MIQAFSAGSSPTSAVPKRILVVDDNVDAAVLMGMLLREEGHEVELAHDGPAALQAATASLPDVVLLDIGLPLMDGNEVARRMRQQPALQRTLLVAVSGYGQPDRQRQSLEAGFNAYLVKPITLETLNRILASVPGRH